MRIYPVSTARADWYDRNPIASNNDYTITGLAPAALTTRWTYTVATGRKTFIGALQINTERANTATSAATVQSFITYTPSGGAASRMLQTFISDNAVGSRQNAIGASGMVMLAGDNLMGQTQDTSTGGALNYSLSWAGAEFDA